MEKKDQYTINLLLFIWFIVSFLFGEKTPADMYTYMHLHTYVYMRATYQPKIPLLPKKQKTNIPNVKKKALHTTGTNPLHYINIIKSFA